MICLTQIFDRKFWRCAVALLGIAVAWGLAVAPAQAADYPIKPVTIVCWSKPGSPVDVFARKLAQLLEKEFGQPFVVETKAGGSGVVAVNYLLSRPADGYTIMTNTATLTTLFSEKGVKFKAADLQMIARLQVDPFGLLVPAASPLKTIDDMLKQAKANPGKIKVGGPFAMSAHRVAFEKFMDAAGIDTTWVPFEGGGPVLTAVAGAHVDVGHTNPGNAKAQIAAGKVRVLAVSTDQRHPDFPDAPTYKEKGINVVAAQWRGVMAKAGTPKPVVDRLSVAIQKIRQTEEWKAFLKQVGQLDGYLDPAAFTNTVLTETKEIEQVKKKLGL
jgi:putative tricarboxylic transport membrane protein